MKNNCIEKNASCELENFSKVVSETQLSRTSFVSHGLEHGKGLTGCLFIKIKNKLMLSVTKKNRNPTQYLLFNGPSPMKLLSL